MNRKIVFLSLVVLAIAITILIANYYNVVISSQHSSRHIVEQVHFEYLWSNDYTFIGGNRFQRPIGFLRIENGFILLLTVRQGWFGQNWILQKDVLQTGKSVWEINFDSTVIKGVINDSANIFVVSSIQRACGITWKPSCEAIRVTSYDISSSDEKWSQVYDGMLNIEWIEVDEIIELHGSANRGNHRATFKIDSNTGVLIWDGEPTLSLQEISDKVKQQSEYLIPQDITSPISSNFANCNNIAYFVTAYGVLFAVDQHSQSIIGMVDFSPKEYDINIFDVQIHCEDFFVVVYFEDSRQIFAFRFSKNDGD